MGGKGSMKKLLILGGKPIGSCELVNYAKGNNIYTIVTDYLPVEESPAKKIADEHWDISTADVDLLEMKIKEENVDGIITGVHGFNINKMAKLAQRLNMPCYCTVEQRRLVSDKKKFKALCKKHGIRVSMEYEINPLTEDADIIDFPVVVKPSDSGGSAGFSLCTNKSELIEGYQKARDISPTASVLIEEFVPYNSVIIHYTVRNGEFIFSGMSDKISMKLGENGSSVMALQLFPSKNVKEYLSNINDKAIEMFKSIGIKQGPIWIEAFNNNGEFIFNEMGFRLGGSLTNYPVKYFYGIDQVDDMIKYSLGEELSIIKENNRECRDNYCILPIHIKPGKITSIYGEDIVKKFAKIIAVVKVHHVGDLIENWGNAKQVYAYLHIKYSDIVDLKNSILLIKSNYKVCDENGKDMLFYLFNINSLE